MWRKSTLENYPYRKIINWNQAGNLENEKIGGLLPCDRSNIPTEICMASLRG